VYVQVVSKTKLSKVSKASSSAAAKNLLDQIKYQKVMTSVPRDLYISENDDAKSENVALRSKNAALLAENSALLAENVALRNVITAIECKSNRKFKCVNIFWCSILKCILFFRYFI